MYFHFEITPRWDRYTGRAKAIYAMNYVKDELGYPTDEFDAVPTAGIGDARFRGAPRS